SKRVMQALAALVDEVNLKKTKGFISVIAMIIGILAGVSQLFPALGTHSAFYGIWASNYSYPVPNGKVEVDSTTEYFKNGSYNYLGQVSIIESTNKGDNIFVYEVNATGDWNNDSKNLYIKLQDIKSQIKKIKINSEEVDVIALKGVMVLPKIEDVLSKGTNEQYEILSCSNNEILLKVDDPFGDFFNFVMKRTTKRFQFKRS
ncbi:hypothetical protein, partial [Aliivibrio fischeri]|uniref:hypothetical protein n=1 Tax=Aliivibrio fischeri TaxID=668 RepID=UPI001BE4963A